MSSDASPPEATHRQEPYTIFSTSTKRMICLLLSTSMLASSLTATIYLPLLPLLSRQFHASAQAINLTITVYICFMAVAPLLLSLPASLTISDAGLSTSPRLPSTPSPVSVSRSTNHPMQLYLFCVHCRAWAPVPCYHWLMGPSPTSACMRNVENC